MILSLILFKARKPRFGVAGIDCLNSILSMHTGNNDHRQVDRVVLRRGCHVRGKKESIFGIHRDMFLESEMWCIIFNGPVGIQISGVLFFIAILIHFVFRGIRFLSNPFNIFFRNRAAYRLDQAGINSYPFVYGQPMLMELVKTIAVNFEHGIFRHTATESREGRVVRRRLIQRQLEKRFKGNSIIDLAFQFRIGFDSKPFLKQEAFE